MNSDGFMEPNKKEVRFYLDETEYPIRDYVVEWVEWYKDHKKITRTLRSHFNPEFLGVMEVRERIIKMNGDDTPVWFMGALRHLRDHSPRTNDEQSVSFTAVADALEATRKAERDAQQKGRVK